MQTKLSNVGGFAVMCVFAMFVFACSSSSVPKPNPHTTTDGDYDSTSDSQSDSAQDYDVESLPPWQGLSASRCASGAEWGCLDQMHKAPCDANGAVIAEQSVLCLEGCQLGRCVEDIFPIAPEELEDGVKQLDLPEDRYFEPRIHGDYLVVAKGNMYQHSLVLYRISTAEAVAVLAQNGTAEIGDYDIFGEFVVWTDRRNNLNPAIPDSSPFFNSDIFMYDILTGNTYQLTTNMQKQNKVRIWGNYVFFEDYSSFEQDNPQSGRVEISGVDLLTGEQKKFVSIPGTLKLPFGSTSVEPERVNAHIFDIRDGVLAGNIEYEKEGFNLDGDIFWLVLDSMEFHQLFMPMEQSNPIPIGAKIFWFGTYDIGEKTHITDRYNIDTPQNAGWDFHPLKGIHATRTYVAYVRPPAEGTVESQLLVLSIASKTVRVVAEAEGLKLGNATLNTLVYTEPANKGNVSVFVAQWKQCETGDFCHRQLADPALGTCNDYSAECKGRNDCEIPGCDATLGCVVSASTDPNCDDNNPITEADSCVESLPGVYECIGRVPSDYECPDHPEMVKYTTNDGHSYCIDKYEAVLYDQPNCTGNRYGIPDPTDANGTSADDYPEGFPDLVGAPSVGAPFGDQTQEQTTPLYACAKEGELPSVYLTWYQAKQACENAGKRLCTRSELVFACSNEGETDLPYQTNSITGDDPTRCNGAYQNLAPSAPSETGSYKQCHNFAFVYDLSGNVAEWTGDNPVACGDTKCALFYGGAFSSPAQIMLCNDSNLMFYARPNMQSIAIGVRCCLDQ